MIGCPAADRIVAVEEQLRAGADKVDVRYRFSAEIEVVENDEPRNLREDARSPAADLESGQEQGIAGSGALMPTALVAQVSPTEGGEPPGPWMVT